MLRVKSMFRAPWYGIIIDVDDRDIATVAVLFDRHCNPIRKAKFHQLHVGWLKILGSNKQPSKRAGLLEEIPDFMVDSAEMMRLIRRTAGCSPRYPISLPRKVDI